MVGRNDDIAEELKENGEGLVLERVTRFVLGVSKGALNRALTLALKVPNLIKGIFGG